MRTEQELVERIIAGDRAAFRDLVMNYQRLVLRLVMGIVSNPADADEVCQEVFMRVFRGLPDFRRDAKLSTWVGRIAIRTALKHAAKKRLPEAKESEVERHERTSTAAESPFDETARALARAVIRSELALLPPDQRVAVTAHYLEGLTITEVAELMQMPEGTVKSHLYRARQVLRTKLGPHLGDQDDA